MRPLPPLNTLLLATFPYLLPTVTAMPPWSTSPLPLLPLQALRQRLTSQPRPLAVNKDLPTPPADLILPPHVSVSIVLVNPTMDDTFPPPPAPPGEGGQVGGTLLAGDGDEEAESIQLLAPIKFLPPPSPLRWSSDHPELAGGEPLADTFENDIAPDRADTDLDASMSLVAPALVDDDNNDNDNDNDNDDKDDDPASPLPNHSLYPDLDLDSDRGRHSTTATHPKPINDVLSSSLFPAYIPKQPDPNCSPAPHINPSRYPYPYYLSPCSSTFPTYDYATSVTRALHTLIPATALQSTIFALACWLTLCVVVGKCAGSALRRRRLRARLLRRRGAGGGVGGGRGAGDGAGRTGGREYGGYGGYGGVDGVDGEELGKGLERPVENRDRDSDGVFVEQGGWDGGGGGVGGFENVAVVGVGLEVSKRKSLGSLKRVWFSDEEERGEEGRFETVWLDDDHDDQNRSREGEGYGFRPNKGMGG